MPELPLGLEVDIALCELDVAQTVLDKKKQTMFGRIPPYRSRLHTAQLNLDYQRARLEAAKKYLADTNQ